MAQPLLTGIAVLAIAVIITASQPSFTQIEKGASRISPDSAASQSFIDLNELPAGSTVVSTTTTYQSPGGLEEIGFSLAVNSLGVIVEAKTAVLGKSPTTVLRQNSFAESFPEAVEGKKLADLGPIDRVGGSSLTTKAFNNALADLQAQL